MPAGIGHPSRTRPIRVEVGLEAASTNHHAVTLSRECVKFRVRVIISRKRTSQDQGRICIVYRGDCCFRGQPVPT